MKTVAFFLIPKQDVVFLDKNATVRQALEKMEYHRYTAIPLIDGGGKYVGTLTEGDLLWEIKNTGLNFENSAKISLERVPKRMKYQQVRINATMEELIGRAIEQSFIPVVDDEEVFIGIVRRREIIEYCSQLIPYN